LLNYPKFCPSATSLGLNHKQTTNMLGQNDIHTSIEPTTCFRCAKMNLKIYNVVYQTLAKLVKNFLGVGIKTTSKDLLYLLKPNLEKGISKGMSNHMLCENSPTP